MTQRHALRRFAVGSLLTVAALGAWAIPSNAGTYEVVACDAASTQIAINNSWTLSGSPGTGRTLCPSQAGDQTYRGIATRMVDGASAGEHDRATFYAPGGTTITGFSWAGRWTRNHCSWVSEIRARPSETVLIGRRNGTDCTYNDGSSSQPLRIPVPLGTTQLMQNAQCGAGSCPNGAAFHTWFASVTVQDPTPPNVAVTGGGIASDRWLSGVQQAGFAASDNSGIGQVAADVGGETLPGKGWLCDFTRPTPCENRTDSFSVRGDLADGAHTLRLTVTDAAGNRGSTTRTFTTDNTPPARVRPELDGGSGWRRENGFTVRWQNHPDAFAPIVRARYRLCSAAGRCAEGSRSGRDINELVNLPVEALGDNTVEVWLEDEAGNQNAASASDPVHLRLDPEAPRLSFLAQDPSDPLTIAVRAVDAYSGVAAGEIEMRRKGASTWHTLSTRLEPGRLAADIDDERFRSGDYEFRASATDQAGNQSSTGTRADGSVASVRLPVRVTTRINAGFTKVKTRRRVLRRGGRRRVVRRKVRVLVHSGRVAYRRRARVSGRLTNPDGQPIDETGVTVLARRDLPGDGFRTVGFVRTDSKGRFAYRLRGTASRVLRFRYEGSRRIRGSTRDVRVTVPAAGTIRTSRSRLLNGQAVTFRGRVLTRPIPTPGKLVEIQAFFRGRWRTISTTRTDSRGRWRFNYRFGATTGVVRYRFRALLSREGGYPFATGASPVVAVTVRGL